MTQPAARTDLRAPEIAARLVSARLDARALEAYPGAQPVTLEQGYLIQEVAIHLWPDEIVGWKIGLVPPPLRERLGADRVAGPIFSRAVRTAGGVVEFPVFEGGFAAVEAEFVFRMGRDAPAGKTQWTEDEAAAHVAALHIGVETAGSPMRFINELGPCIVASDFGNNAGLIVGPEVANWRARLKDLRARTEINGKAVGEGAAQSLPGGLMTALTYLLSHLASRNRPLKAGEYVSSGAVTGVHDIRVGEASRLAFGDDGVIECRAVKAMPSGSAPR
jgi:2-keto-4-pentenoate hydratase